MYIVLVCESLCCQCCWSNYLAMTKLQITNISIVMTVKTIACSLKWSKHWTHYKQVEKIYKDITGKQTLEYIVPINLTKLGHNQL